MLEWVGHEMSSTWCMNSTTAIVLLMCPVFHEKYELNLYTWCCPPNDVFTYHLTKVFWLLQLHLRLLWSITFWVSNLWAAVYRVTALSSWHCVWEMLIYNHIRTLWAMVFGGYRLVLEESFGDEELKKPTKVSIFSVMLLQQRNQTCLILGLSFHFF